MPKVLVPLAAGCEELEAVTIIDLLRRANIEVVTASLDNNPVTCSRGTVLIADQLLDNILDEDFDLIALPGGLPGADHLNNDPRIHLLLDRMKQQDKPVAAICAAPKVLLSNGILKGKKATAYPGVLEALETADTKITGNSVEVDDKVITSRGPGTAMDFALELIEILLGSEARMEVETPLQRTQNPGQ